MDKALHHSRTILIPSTFGLVIRWRLGWDHTEGEREVGQDCERATERDSRIPKKEEENAPLCKLCIPNPINVKPNSPLIDPLIPIPEKEEEKDHVTDYSSPSPIFMAICEEDTPTLVNNLVPKAIPGEKTDPDRTEEDKLVGDRWDLGNITDEDIEDDADDSNSIYLY